MIKRIIPALPIVVLSIVVLGAIGAFVHLEMIEKAIGIAILGIFAGFVQSKHGKAALKSFAVKHPKATKPLGMVIVVVALTGLFLTISFPY